MLKQARKAKKSISKKLTVKLICPYCKYDELINEVDKSEDEYTCEKCNKKFLAVIGQVRAARGLGGHVAPTVTIRLNNVEGGERSINYFSTHQGNDFRSGDLIGIIYKKGWLTGSYRTKQYYILNWTTGVYSDKL